jgi:hypothetical protein
VFTIDCHTIISYDSKICSYVRPSYSSYGSTTKLGAENTCNKQYYKNNSFDMKIINEYIKVTPHHLCYRH